MSQSSINANRRRTSRQPPKKSTKVRCHKGLGGMGPDLARTLLDVSVDGACLVVSAPLEKGEEVLLSLEAHWHPRPILISAHIRWCTTLSDGTCCIGVHFRKTLSFNEIEALAPACGG